MGGYIRIRLAGLIIFVFICGCLYLNSTTWFRLKLAENYENKQNYIKSVQVYNKILRKDRLEKCLNEQALSRIYFKIGCVYSELKLENSAIESFAKCDIKFFPREIDNYYTGQNLEKEKLLAIGLLEAGKFNIAIEQFQKLKQLYPRFEKADKYINTLVGLKKQNARLDNRAYLFILGGAYIKNQLLGEAKTFFAKRIIDYGISPVEVLSYLHKKYSKDKEIIKEVWGDNIYVTLEDFESIGSCLTNWVSIANANINNQYTSISSAYKGRRSEFLDITYCKAAYDYWTKSLDIPLSKADFMLGIRVFIKSNEPFKGYLEVNFSFPSQGVSGIWQEDASKDAGEYWQERRIDDLYGKAKIMASKFNWDISGIKLDRVIINTAGISNQCYFDEIELFLLN